MSSLADLCPPSSILLDVPARTVDDLFEHAACFAEHHYALPAALVLHKLQDRERLGSTALGRGVAIPHARIDGLDHPVMIYLRPTLPLDADTPDGKGLSEFLFLLMPAKACQQHLQALADVAAALHLRDFRQALRDARSATAVHRVLATAPVHVSLQRHGLLENAS
ncbi:PTS sugar transporter subunit IIA [Silvimonas iriomotensis]|uniref:PTS sugar transporter subunit IIA n=1 Tax=Silvimonas iriomotensis TaxID=449662 RepID=A0ABQ2P815_9NEIS|nr:PTS sugar transporter subunit IIA [Silvimonas iriomotensis]GGP20466.1 PTS sugar transporter subunit IIA [Silvimonas iriomotensis]